MRTPIISIKLSEYNKLLSLVKEAKESIVKAENNRDYFSSETNRMLCEMDSILKNDKRKN